MIQPYPTNINRAQKEKKSKIITNKARTLKESPRQSGQKEYNILPNKILCHLKTIQFRSLPKLNKRVHSYKFQQ
jgi:hypothetical protein